MFKIKVAIFPGHFDPINNGQLDIIKKASLLFDKLIVLVIKSSKKSLFPVENRLRYIKSATLNLSNVEVDFWPKLLSEYVKLCGACAIVRGLKNSSNITREMNLKIINENLTESIQTIFLMPNPKNMYIDSELVRNLCILKKNLNSVIPKSIEKEIKDEV